MKNKFGERLRELRRDKGLSQKELGIKFGFSQTGIAKWEKGIREPNLDDLIMIADFFWCFDRLFSWQRRLTE